MPFKTATEQLTQTPISENELFLIKQDEKGFLSKSRDEQNERTWALVGNYSGGNNYLNEYAREIDKITVADIQKAAQEYLTQPSIAAIGES